MSMKITAEHERAICTELFYSAHEQFVEHSTGVTAFCRLSHDVKNMALAKDAEAENLWFRECIVELSSVNQFRLAC